MRTATEGRITGTSKNCYVATIEPILVLQFFGTFRASRSGIALPSPRARKVLLLLTLLTLRTGQPVERNYLAGTLWPDSDDRTGAMSLRRALSDLRAWLGMEAHRLTSPTSQTIALNWEDGVFIDVLAFDKAVYQWNKQGQIAAAEEAITLYRGALLIGFDDLALTGERVRRAEQCREMLEAISRRVLAAGDVARAIRLVRRAEEIEPLSQSVQRLLYECLARNGDLPAALRAYRNFRILLHRETNQEPDAATVMCIQRLRQEPQEYTPVAVVPKPSLLPVFLTSLIGRKPETESISTRLFEPDTRLLTLTGIGGIGKTRLAIAAAGQMGEASFTDLSTFTSGNITESAIFEAILRNLDDAPLPPNRMARAELTARLAERPVLLVLDNCEQIVPTISHVIETILKETPYTKVLATSRMPLGVSGEAYWPVSPIALNEAITLFTQRARAVRPDFAVTPANQDSIRALCVQLDCIPLAIELAAARIRALPLEKIRERLTASLELLANRGNNPNVPARQQTMNATLEWSYALLTEMEKSLLQALSVFLGGWTLEAAEQVCVSNDVTSQDVIELLTSLLDKSLVVYEEAAREARYRLLGTVRQYVQEKQSSVKENRFRQQHRDYFLGLAEKIKPKLIGSEQVQGLNVLETEYDNLREAMRFCREQSGEAETGLRLGVALQRFWEVRGYLHEGQERLMELLALPEVQVPTETRADALSGAGTLAYRRGDFAAAQSLYEECLAIRRTGEDKAGIADVRGNLGTIAFSQGNYTLARSLFEEWLAIQREAGNKANIANSLNNLAVIAHVQGDYAAARLLFEESLAVKREIGDLSGVASTLNNLGVLSEQEGDYPTARAYLEESLSLLREVKDKRGMAITLNSLGDVVLEQGDYTLAHSYNYESLVLRREVGDRAGIAYALEAFAVLNARQQKFEQAVHLWGAALELRKQIGFPIRISEQERYDREILRAREAWEEGAFSSAWEQGSLLTMEQAIEIALQ